MRWLLALLTLLLAGVPGGASAGYAVYPPFIRFVAPASDARYVAPAEPVFYVAASPSYGDPTVVPPTSIAQVEFFDGDTLIGTITVPNNEPSDRSPKYVFTWDNPPLGMHSIHARVTDTAGNSATTIDLMQGQPPPLPLIVAIVSVNPSPQISVLTPTTGQVFTWAAPVPLATNATSAQASIRRVEFVAGDTVVAIAQSPPYRAQWNNPPPGDFSVVAKAYDDRGVAAASSPVYIRVLPLRAPALVLTAPSPGATIPSGAPLTLAAVALSPDSTIDRVDFYFGTNLIGSSATPPYNYSWATPQAGVLSLTAKAYDLQGTSATSTPVSITVGGGAAPVVSLVAPAAGAKFTAPATIGLSANASEPGGSIVKVEFFLGEYVIGTATTAPYNATWNGVGAGTYLVMAKATDTRGATAYSTAVAITVGNNQPPTIALTAPSSGQNFLVGQPIALSATASDLDGTITKVEFLSDGAVVGTMTTGPYAMTWNSAAVGSHALTARATDNLGATTIATIVNITVASHGAPTIALTLPRTGQIFSTGAPIAMAATAAAGDGTIARVEFYADSVLVATATATSYVATWSGATVGAHTLTAKAIDDRGAVTASAAVTIQVAPVALTITTPAPNATIEADFVLVGGTYQGPPNSGVTVNGIASRNDGQGHYFVNNLPLVDGMNTLTVTLTAQDGQTTTQTQTITGAGIGPMRVYADPDADFAPATYTVLITNRTANTITNISYSNLGGGQFDKATQDSTTLGRITYSLPGVYMPQFVISDSAGNTYTQTLAILVQDKAVLDQMLKAVWGDFNGALSAGNKVAAMQRLNGPAQEKYGTVFNALMSHMADIVATWSVPQTGMLSDDIADFAINRTIDGINRIFFINLIRENDGVWRLDSM